MAIEAGQPLWQTLRYDGTTVTVTLLKPRSAHCQAAATLNDQGVRGQLCNAIANENLSNCMGSLHARQNDEVLQARPREATATITQRLWRQRNTVSKITWSSERRTGAWIGPKMPHSAAGRAAEGRHWTVELRPDRLRTAG